MDRPQLVIVALPSESDRVRDFSSEKEPHLTLLYLGETDLDPAKFSHVVGYLEHVAFINYQFTLDVERRGSFDSNDADVLFFSKNWSEKNAERLRNQLLQDPIISASYSSVEQFPEWNPHLTMGWPDTPAKPMTRDDFPITYITFDRIALWVEDSDGPTFDLKTYDPYMEVAMSQIKSSSIGDGVLKHYGVKGMKWGVRRAESGGSQASADAKEAASSQDRVNKGGVKVLSNRELQALIQRKNLEKQYNDLMGGANKGFMDNGNQRVQKLLKYGKTYNDIQNFLNTPAGKNIKRGFKIAGMAAKVGAAAATGGTGAAAATGASLVVRRAANHYTNVGN